MTKLALGERIDIIPGLLSWERVHNVRTAYGIFSAQPRVFVALSTVILAVFSYCFREPIARAAIPRMAFAAIVGGAIGNIVDRIRYGFVVDFISLPPLPIFEVFHVADLCVSIGVVVLFVTTLENQRGAKRMA